MKTTNKFLISIFYLLCCLGFSQAQADVRLSFDRSGTTGQSVKVMLTDENGKTIEGASATVSSSHAFMPTKASVTKNIITPMVNATENQTVRLTFRIMGLPSVHKFNKIGLDLHAFNKSGGYQRNGGDAPRQYVIKSEVGKIGASTTGFGVLDNIDIAANIGEEGNVHKMWMIENEQMFTAEGDFQIVVSINTGAANKGCFIGLSEVRLTTQTDDPKPGEICPFQLSPAIGQANVCYAITTASGKVLSMDKAGQLRLADNNYKENQHWYFVAAENGYFVINLDGHRVYSTGSEQKTAWSVVSNEKGFSFIPTATKEDAKTMLTVDGETVFHFSSVHNSFARAGQIYKIPCGVLGSNYITGIDVTGDVLKPMHFPLSIVKEGSIVVPNAEKPMSEYTIYTHDQAYVIAGLDFTTKLQLNAAPVEGLEGFVYFDWDRDGIFEVCQPFAMAQTTIVKTKVPADAQTGKTRVRIRLTDNGMIDGDDDANGQIFDWLLNVVEGAPESYRLNAVANDDNRGSVTVDNESGWFIECEAKATPKGNATFVCWREGHQIVSLEADYKFTLNHETRLVGVFSPNTDDTVTGIENLCAVKNQMIDVTADHKTITVNTVAPIKQVLVFSPDGQLVARSTDNVTSLSNVPAGTYIVKVYTNSTDNTAKILLK